MRWGITRGSSREGGADVLTWLARLIVRMSPSAWRERYEDEVLALVDDGAVRLGDVCGLLRHCITERVLALYEPGRHISAYRFISGMALLTYIAVLFLAVASVGASVFGMGYLVQRLFGPFPSEWLDTIAWLYLPIFLLLVVPAFVRLFRLRSAQMKTGTPLPPEAARLRWMIIGGYVMLTFLNGLGTDLSFGQLFSAVMRSWILVFMLWEFPEDININWPGRGLFETLGRLRSVRYDLRWARMELERCEGIYAGREPGPELRAARAEMERLLAAEQTALSELDAMGYQARFQS
jgi:uncharacterized membrane protein